MKALLSVFAKKNRTEGKLPSVRFCLFCFNGLGVFRGGDPKFFFKLPGEMMDGGVLQRGSNFGKIHVQPLLPFIFCPPKRAEKHTFLPLYHITICFSTDGEQKVSLFFLSAFFKISMIFCITY